MEPEELLSTIKKHINVFEGLFRNSYTFFHDSEFLHLHTHSDDAPCEFRFLGPVRISHYIVAVLELSKIVLESDSHHYNIYKLFEQIELYNNLTNQQVIQINTVQYKYVLEDNYLNTIQRIRILRDKAFAHTDKNTLNSKYTFKLTFSEIKDLLQYLNDLIDELYLKVLDKSEHQIALDSGAQNTYELVEANI